MNQGRVAVGADWSSRGRNITASDRSAAQRPSRAALAQLHLRPRCHLRRAALRSTMVDAPRQPEPVLIGIERAHVATILEDERRRCMHPRRPSVRKSSGKGVRDALVHARTV